MNDTPRLMSISDAAAQLGYADGSTLRRLAASGHIPGAIKIGKTWILPIAWVKDQGNIARDGRGWARGVTDRKK
jgi:hypothetical protein